MKIRFSDSLRPKLVLGLPGYHLPGLPGVWRGMSEHLNSYSLNQLGLIKLHADLDSKIRDWQQKIYTMANEGVLHEKDSQEILNAISFYENTLFPMFIKAGLEIRKEIFEQFEGIKKRLEEIKTQKKTRVKRTERQKGTKAKEIKMQKQTTEGKDKVSLSEALRKEKIPPAPPFVSSRAPDFIPQRGYEQKGEVFLPSKIEISLPPGKKLPRTFGNILKLVANIYDIPEKELLGTARYQIALFVQAIAIYLARKLLPHSISDLADLFQKGHYTSSTSSAIKKIEKLCNKNKELKELLEKIEQSFEEAGVNK